MTNTKTKAEPKLSVIRKGHWRNKWNVDGGSYDASSGVFVAGGVIFGSARFVSAELAEHAAMVCIAGQTDPPEYLGPIFFPEDAQ